MEEVGLQHGAAVDGGAGVDADQVEFRQPPGFAPHGLSDLGAHQARPHVVQRGAEAHADHAGHGEHFSEGVGKFAAPHQGAKQRHLRVLKRADEQPFRDDRDDRGGGGGRDNDGAGPQQRQYQAVPVIRNAPGGHVGQGACVDDGQVQPRRDEQRDHTAGFHKGARDFQALWWIVGFLLIRGDGHAGDGGGFASQPTRPRFRLVRRGREHGDQGFARDVAVRADDGGVAHEAALANHGAADVNPAAAGARAVDQGVVGEEAAVFDAGQVRNGLHRGDFRVLAHRGAQCPQEHGRVAGCIKKIRGFQGALQQRVG